MYRIKYRYFFFFSVFLALHAIIVMVLRRWYTTPMQHPGIETRLYGKNRVVHTRTTTTNRYLQSRFGCAYTRDTRADIEPPVRYRSRRCMRMCVRVCARLYAACWFVESTTQGGFQLYPIRTESCVTYRYYIFVSRVHSVLNVVIRIKVHENVHRERGRDRDIERERGAYKLNKYFGKLEQGY